MEKILLALYLIGLLTGCASSTTHNYYIISGDGNAIDSTGDARTERPIQIDAGNECRPQNFMESSVGAADYPPR